MTSRYSGMHSMIETSLIDTRQKLLKQGRGICLVVPQYQINRRRFTPEGSSNNIGCQHILHVERKQCDTAGGRYEGHCAR